MDGKYIDAMPVMVYLRLSSGVINMYGVWNSMKKEWQFQNCNSETEQDVWEKLSKRIGYDSLKYRFEVLDIDKKNKKIEDNKTGWNDKLWFGKHKGEFLKDCPKHYVKWLIKNTRYEFKDEVLNYDM